MAARRRGAAARGGRRRAAAGRGGPHPSLEITGSDGRELAGRRVVLCVSGSVAAYKAIELARLLMRRGASVTCVASAAATRLVRPAYLEWATGRAAVTRLTGGMEHVGLAERGRTDLVVAYPATANTIGRMANGMDDSAVSTVLTVALGAGAPVLVCPAMHGSMYRNAAVSRNVEFLRGRGVRFVGPRSREGRARAAEPGEVLAEAMRALRAGGGELAGMDVLLTAGPTAEPIDPVRHVSSRSTGRTGEALAAELARAGARVTAVWGPAERGPPPGARAVRVSTAAEMAAAVEAELRRRRYGAAVMAAAVSDYAPRPLRRKMVSSREYVDVRMRRTPKIIDRARALRPEMLLVGFKAEAGVSAAALEARARRKLRESGADLIVANDVGSARHLRSPGSNEALLVRAGGSRRTGWMPKEGLAREVVREMGRLAAARRGGGGGG